MSRTQKSPRSKELAQIHIGATALGLIRSGDDSAYRAMLQTVARVSSSKDLDHAGRAAVLDHLRGCGWKGAPRKGGSRYRRGSQAALIRHLWSELHRAGRVRDGSDLALRRFVEGQSAVYNGGVGYSAPQLLPVDVASKVIEAMKRWLDRKSEPEAAPQ